MSEVYYYGCASQEDVGHFLFSPGMRSVREENIMGWPWKWGELDGKYAPSGRVSTGDQPQSVARLVHHAGWTVLALWDRSADLRGNSNAAFVARGEHDYEAMVALAKESFSTVWARIDGHKPVTPWGGA